MPTKRARRVAGPCLWLAAALAPLPVPALAQFSDPFLMSPGPAPAPTAQAPRPAPRPHRARPARPSEPAESEPAELAPPPPSLATPAAPSTPPSASLPPQAQQLLANADKVRVLAAQAAACESVIYAAPEAEPIRRHSPYSAAQLTPAQLSDPGYAGADEVAAINTVYPRLQQCHQNTLSQLSGAVPALVPVVAQEYAAGAQRVTLLREHRITWGEFNRQGRDAAARLQGEMLAALGLPANPAAVAPRPQPAAPSAQIYFGSIAYDQYTGRYGVSWNKPTQSEADYNARLTCRPDLACAIVMRIPPHLCWALAQSGNRAGWAARPTRAEAMSAALQECQQRAIGCAVRGSDCNQ